VQCLLFEFKVFIGAEE